MRRAQAQTITFPVYDASTGARQTGLTFSAGELQWSKDGVAFVNVAGTPSEIALSGGGGSGVYALTLSVSEAAAGWGHLLGNKAGCEPIDVSGALGEQPSAAVVADAANTALTFVTNLTETANDFWKGAGLTFTSGALKGQVREVASYNGTTKAITLAVALTSVPAGTDAFNIVNG